MYESGIGSGYGNEDSFFRPSDFDQPANPGVLTTGFVSPNVEGVYGWYNTGADYIVDAADIAKGYVEFKIDDRERGLSVDRIVFSTTNNLSSAQLDALANSAALGQTQFTGGGGTQDWSTAANWDNGVPTASSWALIGDNHTVALDQPGQVSEVLTIGHVQATLSGNGTLNQSAGDLTIIGGLAVGEDGQTGVYTASGGTLTVGQVATGRAQLVVGRVLQDIAASSNGTLNLSGASQLDAYLDQMIIGQRVAGGSLGGLGVGTVTLAQSNTIDATSILISDSNQAGYTTATQSTLTLGPDNTILADTITVAARKGVGRIDITAGGSLALGTPARRADLYIARKTINSSVDSVGVVDLSAGSILTAYFDEVYIGSQVGSAAGTGDALGTLTLAPTSMIDATAIVLGRQDVGISEPTTGTLNLGASTTLITNSLIVGSNKGTGTLTLPAGGTLTLTGPGATRADLMVGYNNTTTTYTPPASMMNVAAGTMNALLDELIIGWHLYPWSDTTTGGGTGTLSFGGGSIDANTVIIGQAGINPTYQRHGAGIGTLNISGGTLTAGSIALGVGSNRSKGTITMTAGTIQVAGAVTGDALGTGTLNLDGGTMTVGTGLEVDSLRVGRDGRTATLTVTSGPVLIGTGTQALEIARKATSGVATTYGTLDLSNASSVVMNLGDLRVGYATAGGSPDNPVEGKLYLSPNNTITANNIVVADSSAPSLGGRNSEIRFGLVNNVQTDRFLVGGGKGRATVSIVPGGSLALGTPARRADLYIARKTIDSGVNSVGVVDLSAGSTLTAVLDELALGTQTPASAGSGGATGTLSLAANNTIDANSILLGDLDGGIDTTTSATLNLGAVNTLITPLMIVGGRKATATVALPAGGVLTLTGPAGTPASLRVGYNFTNTSAQTTGTMNLASGTFNATLDQLVIGYHASKSGGRGTGTLTFAAGTVTANRVILGDAGTSADGDGTGIGTLTMAGGTLTVAGDMSLGTGTAASQGTVNLNGGTLAIGGNLIASPGTSTLLCNGTANLSVGGTATVDNFLVGQNGQTGNLTVSGSQFHLAATNLYVGRRTGETSAHSLGTLHLEGVSNVALTAVNLGLGIGPGSASAQGQARGEVFLGAQNTIQAQTITMASSVSVGLGGQHSRLRLGSANTILANTLIVGGDKGIATLDFLAPGSTLELGTAAQRVDVWVGRQTVGTAGGSTGIMNMAGSTFNAFIDEWVIGSKPNSAAGTTSGTVTMTDGTLDANSIVLGRRNDAGTAGRVDGVFNLQGGWLKAGSITRGPDVGSDNIVFNFTGGRLSVGTFGSVQHPFDLVQAGGILAPGTSPGTTNVIGNFLQQSAGVYEVEISGYDQGDLSSPDGFGYDFTRVSATASLDGDLRVLLVDGFYPRLGDVFDVLTAADVALGVHFELDQSMAGLGGGSFIYRVLPGGNGEILQLQYVPEPGASSLACLLLALAGGGFLARHCRRRARRRPLPAL